MLNLKDKSELIKVILKLSIPIVLANTLQSAYQLTDTFWVGRLGADAVAAISLCYPLIFVLLSMGIGFSVAGAVLVSQYSGKNDRKMIDYISSQTMLVMFVIAIFLSVAGYGFSKTIVESMGVSGSVAYQATRYLEISFIGLTFQYIYLTFQNILRGVGNVNTPFVIVLITVILNFFLDPIFIMGYGPIPAMGVEGAAYATIITQAISAVVGIYLLLNTKHGASLKLSLLRPNFLEIKRIFLLGAPASAEGSTRALSMTVMTYLVTTFGTHTTAVFGIGIRILSFVIIPALGFSQATSALVGKSIGAQDEKKAYEITQYSLGIIFISLTLIGVLFYFGAEEVVRIFIPDDPTVIAEGSVFIKIIALTFGFVGIQQVINGAFRGGGSTTLAMLLAIISMWVFRFPIAYLLSKHTTMNENGIWWAFSLSNIFAGVVALILYKRGKWIKNLVLESEQEKLENEVLDENMPKDI